MNSIFDRRVVCICLAMLFVTTCSPTIAAEKNCLSDKWRDHPICTGADPEPDPTGTCANFATPDFAFWRDSTTKRVPAVTVFVAESATGCEKELVRIDLSESGPINLLNLAYSSVGVENTFFGRVVFEREEWLDSSQGDSVWKYDFQISGGEIVPISAAPVMVLENDHPENQSVRSLDLSADTSSLVWHSTERNGDLSSHSIYTLDIDECTHWPCTTINGGVSRVQSVYHVLGTGSSWGTRLGNPTWGPYGERIYYLVADIDGDLISQYLMAVSSDGLDPGQATTIFGIENQVLGEPGYRTIRTFSSGLSGWPDAGEFLAVEIGESNYLYSCADVFTLNVANCTGGCELQYETQGAFPSWTKSGEIIHSGLGNACKFNQIGLWFGGALKSLTKGFEPEAAGGEVEGN